VPPEINKGLMDNLSGGVQSHLLSALRFLGLVEGDEDSTTPELEKLVESYGTEGYKSTLEAVLNNAYEDITTGINIANTSAKALDVAFGRENLDGSMRTRAIRFYLRGLESAGVAISPHLGKRKARSPGPPKPRKKKQATRSGKTATPEDEERGAGERLPPGLIEFPIPIGNSAACIRVPKDITPKQMPLIQAIVSAVDALAKQNSGEDEE